MGEIIFEFLKSLDETTVSIVFVIMILLAVLAIGIMFISWRYNKCASVLIGLFILALIYYPVGLGLSVLILDCIAVYSVFKKLNKG